MYAIFSIQRAKIVSAFAHLDLQSVPLTIRLGEKDDSGIGQFSVTEICLHLEDAALAADLVEAINSVIAKHAAAPAPSEQNDVADYNQRPDDEEVLF